MPQSRPSPAFPPGQRGQDGPRGDRWQGQRAQNFRSEHRSWQDRGGYGGYRIPDSRFRGHFGMGHAFRMARYPMVMVGGSARFQCNGFWFSQLDPWPEYWDARWYDDDDMFVICCDGGYYLSNRRYPADRIAISVSLS